VPIGSNFTVTIGKAAGCVVNTISINENSTLFNLDVTESNSYTFFDVSVAGSLEAYCTCEPLAV